MLPQGLDGSGILLHLTNPEPQPVLKHSLRQGVALTVDEIKKVYRELHLKYPQAKKKEDFVRGLINHVFASDTAAAREELVLQMMGKRYSPPEDESPHNILEVVAGLDAENSAEFTKIQQFAEQEKLRSLERKVEAKLKGFQNKLAETKKDLDPDAAEKERRVKLNKTPIEIRDLIPEQGLDPNIYIQRHPVLKFYQCHFPGPRLSLSNVSSVCCKQSVCYAEATLSFLVLLCSPN